MKTKVVSVRLDKDLYEKVMCLAERNKEPISRTVERIIIEYLTIQLGEDSMIRELTLELQRLNAAKLDVVKKFMSLSLSKEAAKQAWDIAHEL